MFHEPPAQFLYSSYKLETEYTDRMGTVKSGVASGFILEVTPKMPWLVTNRHVIDLDYGQPVAKYKDFALTKFHVTGRRSDDTTYTSRIHPNAKPYFHEDEENDVVLIEPRVYLDGPDSWHWHFGMEHLANEEIFKSIRPFDLVCCSGFPDQHDKLGGRPIVRSGHIASDPKFSYSWDQNPHGQCVAYEGFSFSGASGSPVFAPPRGAHGIPDSRHGYLVGVNAGHVPNHPHGHSGVSYFYKSTVILEIIRGL